MSKRVQDQFKENIPAVLKNNELIEQYAEAVGEVFDEMRQEINYRAFETDYAKSRFSSLNGIAANFGLNLSPLLKEEVTRRIIRDAPSVYSQMGTRGSLDWTLKNLGYRSYDIDEAWIPNPDVLRTGYFRELGSESDPVRYRIRKNSYTDFVVGEEYVTEQGTFFKGYEYTDFEKKEEIDGIPIYGEVYSTYTGLSFKDMVSKTPYLIVRLYDPPEYEEVITDVDPISGETINLSLQDRQRIVTETIRYLIQELQRTATTSIILVGDLLIFNDIMGRLLDQFEISQTQDPYITSDSVSSISDIGSENYYMKVGARTINKIGSKRPIGKVAPFPAIGQYLPVGSIGFPASYTDRDITETSRQLDQQTTVVAPNTGYEHVHFLDFDATVNFTVPQGVSVKVETVRNYRYSSSSDRELVGNLTGGQSFNETFADSHAVILTFNDAYDGTLTITSTY